MLLSATLVRDPSPWRWQPHPEVWLLVAGLAVLYWWAVTRIGPRACRPGEPVVSGAQVRWFGAGLVLLWLASDWPVHDLAEEYLYSVHMVQHIALSMFVAPMLLLGTPTWLARLVVGQGRTYRAIGVATRLVPATLAFNAVVLLSHWPWIVDHVVPYAWLHYGVHVLTVGTALLVWTRICGPLPELRYPYPTQMVLLFAQTIVPVLPAGWLVFAQGVVYHSYDVTPRVFGLSVLYDQQLAGALMKLVGSTFLWVVIAVLFFRFAALDGDDRATGVTLDRRAPRPQGLDGDGSSGDGPEADLDWAAVERELAGVPPRPERPRRSP